jgi:hypothetical protein
MLVLKNYICKAIDKQQAFFRNQKTQYNKKVGEEKQELKN